MVKYFAVIAALVASLAVADLAEARGRRGCASCTPSGGCPGGVCALPAAAPAKMAAVSDAPPVVATENSTPAAVAAGTHQPAPTYYTNTARRGVFGWRR